MGCVLRVERETRWDVDGGLLLRSWLWHDERGGVPYVRTIFTGWGDWGGRALKESPAEGRDGCGGEDSHESIVDR